MAGSKSEMTRVVQAAGTYSWVVSLLDGPAAVMATRESGQIGEPWVVMATAAGRGLRVHFYQPGDALDVEGEELAELTGNPRELGRQLRSILEDLAEGRAA